MKPRRSWPPFTCTKAIPPGPGRPTLTWSPPAPKDVPRPPRGPPGRHGRPPEHCNPRQHRAASSGHARGGRKPLSHRPARSRRPHHRRHRPARAVPGLDLRPAGRRAAGPDPDDRAARRGPLVPGRHAGPGGQPAGGASGGAAVGPTDRVGPPPQGGGPGTAGPRAADPGTGVPGRRVQRDEHGPGRSRTRAPPGNGAGPPHPAAPDAGLRGHPRPEGLLHVRAGQRRGRRLLRCPPTRRDVPACAWPT